MKLCIEHPRNEKKIRQYDTMHGTKIVGTEMNCDTLPPDPGGRSHKELKVGTYIQ